jgi:hypothetical protein
MGPGQRPQNVEGGGRSTLNQRGRPKDGPRLQHLTEADSSLITLPRGLCAPEPPRRFLRGILRCRAAGSHPAATPSRSRTP